MGGEGAGLSGRKCCLQRASCAIVIFTVSTSGYAPRSTVTIKQPRCGRERGGHIWCISPPLSYLWSEQGGTSWSFSLTLLFLASISIIPLTNNLERVGLLVASAGSCILNIHTSQSCGGAGGQLTCCLSSDKWQVKKGGAQRHISVPCQPRSPMLITPPSAPPPVVCPHASIILQLAAPSAPL